MTNPIEQALQQDRVVDITTIGRKTGQSHRLEIWFHNLDGRLYITGTPGKRSWYANLVANPDFTFHLKESTQADLPAKACPVTEPAEKRATLVRILDNIKANFAGREPDLDKWVAESPLIEFVVKVD